MAILFSIVKNHNNYVFGDDLLPHSPWGGAASYKLRPVFTYNNGYWEVYRRFQGDFLVLGVGLRVGGYVGGSFLEEICHGGRKIQWKGRRAQDESGHVRKKRQIQSLIYNAGCSEPLYYGV